MDVEKQAVLSNCSLQSCKQDFSSSGVEKGLCLQNMCVGQAALIMSHIGLQRKLPQKIASVYEVREVLFLTLARLQMAAGTNYFCLRLVFSYEKMLRNLPR